MFHSPPHTYVESQRENRVEDVQVHDPQHVLLVALDHHPDVDEDRGKPFYFTNDLHEVSEEEAGQREGRVQNRSVETDVH